VAEQLALQQLGGDRGAVHGNEDPVGPAAVVMDGAGDEFLAGSALPQDEDGGVGRRHLGDQGKHLPDRLADAEDVLEAMPPDGLPPEVGVLLLHPRHLERPVHEVNDFHHLERLRDVVERAELHRLDGVFHRPVPRDQDHLAVQQGLLRVGQDLEPVPSGHHEIREDDVDVVPVDQLLRLRAAAGGEQLEIPAGKGVPEKIEDVFVVFRDQEGSVHRDDCTLPAARGGRSMLRGRDKVFPGGADTDGMRSGDGRSVS
jgi:hypothetical protein